VGALRTAYGRRGGHLSRCHPVDLSSEVLAALLRRCGSEPGLVGEVVWGCATQVGAQSANIGRRAVLAAGWPETVPAWSVESHFASSAVALVTAARSVASGATELAIAGGVESTSAVPAGAALAQPVTGKPSGLRLGQRYGGGAGLPPPGLAAEEVVERWSLGRAALDDWAFGSFAKAALAWAQGRGYLWPVMPRSVCQAAPTAPGGRGATQVRERGHDQAIPPQGADEAIGDPPKREGLAALLPAFLPGGSVTARNMASEGDGAAAVALASRAMAVRLGTVPLARVLSLVTISGPPSQWPVATVPAAVRALREAGVAVKDVGSWWVHESSSAAVLAWAAEMGVALDAVNLDGGELASTSPAGAVGAALFAAAATRLHERGERYALACVAGEGGISVAGLLARPG